MGKTEKTILIVLLIILALIVGTFLLIGALWSGALNFMLPNEIAAYHSPDGDHSFLSKWVTQHGHLVKQTCV